jgi:hypothetical protein
MSYYHGTKKLNINQDKNTLFLLCDNKLYNLNIMESVLIDERAKECRLITEYVDLFEALNKFKNVPGPKEYRRTGN